MRHTDTAVTDLASSSGGWSPTGGAVSCIANPRESARIDPTVTRGLRCALGVRVGRISKSKRIRNRLVDTNG